MTKILLDEKGFVGDILSGGVTPPEGSLTVSMNPQLIGPVPFGEVWLADNCTINDLPRLYYDGGWLKPRPESPRPHFEETPDGIIVTVNNLVPGTEIEISDISGCMIMDEFVVEEHTSDEQFLLSDKGIYEISINAPDPMIDVIERVEVK